MSIPWPFSWRASRCGWPRWQPTGRLHFSIHTRQLAAARPPRPRGFCPGGPGSPGGSSNAGDGRLETAGFDAAIGTPPWDMIRADAGSAESRVRSRTDIAPVLRFARDAGIYTAQSSGHANRYQLFAERALALARHEGRVGLVLPSGLATDHGSAALRRRLLSECDIDALVGIDNQRGVFPIHRSVRFLL